MANTIMLARMMRSPQLNSSRSSTSRLPRPMMVRTPSEDTTMPPNCSAVMRSRNRAALVPTMSTGTSELSTDTLSALVYCRPTYCMAVNSAPPVAPSQSIDFQ